MGAGLYLVGVIEPNTLYRLVGWERLDERQAHRMTIAMRGKGADRG